jgi:phosphoribosylamine--glycine ligase
MLAIARGGSIRGLHLDWHGGAALTTVLAAGGYPGHYRPGAEITIPAEVHEASDVFVYHAGTARTDGHLVTAGGRVLAATALAADLRGAADRSRWAAESIHFAGKYYRRDIGWRELARTALPHA